VSATTVTVSGPALAEAVGRVRHAVSADPELPMLAGVLVEIDPQQRVVRLVATDRYRLALATAPLVETDGPAAEVLLPAEFVREVGERAAGAGSVRLTVDDGSVTVALDGEALTAGSLDLDFPPYRRVLRDESAHTVRTARDDVLAALRGVSDLRVIEGAPVVSIAVDGRGALRVGATSGAAVTALVNQEFLLQAVDASGRRALLLELDDPLAPIVVRDADAPGNMHMVMPVRDE